jgi:hypothetical protein
MCRVETSVALNLLTTGSFDNVAVRDVEMAIAAFVLPICRRSGNLSFVRQV